LETVLDSPIRGVHFAMADGKENLEARLDILDVGTEIDLT